jgi:hypothetical protein
LTTQSTVVLILGRFLLRPAKAPFAVVAEKPSSGAKRPNQLQQTAAAIVVWFLVTPRLSARPPLLRVVVRPQRKPEWTGTQYSGASLNSSGHT